MAANAPLRESDLIFPSASTSIKTALQDLRRTHLSVHNRLKSIKSDAEYIKHIAATLDLPVIANERCGSWYVPPGLKAGSAYFKSTDGHTGQWSFSLRRLNVQLLSLIGQYQGCMIVDTTRRGKSIPDALSKTIPIWCCVMNRFLFPDMKISHDLQTPEDVVSRSEHAQIEARIDDFVRDLKNLGIGANGDEWRDAIKQKPLAVSWQRPGHAMANLSRKDNSVNHVVLCTASNRTSGELSTMADYVQGAADDSESWALGLDAITFWKYADQLLAVAADELPDVIASLLSTSNNQQPTRAPITIGASGSISITDNATISNHADGYDLVISCDTIPDQTMLEQLKDRYVHLKCHTGKVGSRQLRGELTKLKNITATLRPGMRMLVSCQTGKDLSVGVALALMCLHCNIDGSLTENVEQAINKTIIKQKLSRIMVAMPTASPSRATLQSVNAFLMDDR